MKDFILGLMGNDWVVSGVILIVISIFLKIWPNENQAKVAQGASKALCFLLLKWGNFCEGLGKAVTGWGRIKLGKKAWEALEKLFDDVIGNLYRNFMIVWRDNFKVNLIEYFGSRFSKGLNSDDNNGNGKEK